MNINFQQDVEKTASRKIIRVMQDMIQEALQKGGLPLDETITGLLQNPRFAAMISAMDKTAPMRHKSLGHRLGHGLEGIAELTVGHGGLGATKAPGLGYNQRAFSGNSEAMFKARMAGEKTPGAGGVSKILDYEPTSGITTYSYAPGRELIPNVDTVESISRLSPAQERYMAGAMAEAGEAPFDYVGHNRKVKPGTPMGVAAAPDDTEIYDFSFLSKLTGASSQTAADALRTAADSPDMRAVDKIKNRLSALLLDTPLGAQAGHVMNMGRVMVEEGLNPMAKTIRNREGYRLRRTVDSAPSISSRVPIRRTISGAEPPPPTRVQSQLRKVFEEGAPPNQVNFLKELALNGVKDNLSAAAQVPKNLFSKVKELLGQGE